MATFVLVHGSWLGGWSWEGVRVLLEREGHRVLAPSLTGMADRHHLASPEVGLQTHIDDIARLMEWERTQDAILVGHSYGGMVITGAAARSPQRPQRLVYVDAFYPAGGECAWDLLPWQKDAFQPLRLAADPTQVRPVDMRSLFPELADFDESRLTPMPIRTHEDRLAAGRPAGVPVTYVHCTSAPSFFDAMAQRAANDGATVIPLAAGHMAPLSAPQALASILLDLAEPVR